MAIATEGIAIPETANFNTEAPKASTEMSAFAHGIYKTKYSFEGAEEWPDTAKRVVENVLGALGYDENDEEFQKIYELIRDKKVMPAGRYLHAAGREIHQVNNCFLARAEDSREGWAELGYKAFMVLQTGGGFGVDYSNVRPAGSPISKTGGTASGPLPLVRVINEVGRGVMAGGSRRSAILASLNWNHGDIFEFIRAKDWPQWLRDAKADDMTVAAPMDMTNISVGLDDEFFDALENIDHPRHAHAKLVYEKVCDKMLTTAEPGFTVDIGDNAGEVTRNPCGEISSADDSDVCNLASLNLSRISTIEELEESIKYMALLMIAGTVYSDVPYDKVKEVREKNRRLGMGIMGLHEWLIQRGYKYEENPELAEWLEVYRDSTREYADFWADEFNLSRPVKVRAIAPTGTISIIAETTSGIEPIFAVAYKRRVRITDPINGDRVQYEYVVDPTAKRLIDSGANPDDIEDAYTLAYNYEKRIKMQAFLQKYVDHAISVTVNLPYPITDEAEQADFRECLLEYLPGLRGFTAYPSGARGGQPITAVPYSEAVGREGVRFEDDGLGSCSDGSCSA